MDTNKIVGNGQPVVGPSTNIYRDILKTPNGSKKYWMIRVRGKETPRILRKGIVCGRLSSLAERFLGKYQGEIVSNNINIPRLERMYAKDGYPGFVERKYEIMLCVHEKAFSKWVLKNAQRICNSKPIKPRAERRIRSLDEIYFEQDMETFVDLYSERTKLRNSSNDSPTDPNDTMFQDDQDDWAHEESDQLGIEREFENTNKSTHVIHETGTKFSTSRLHCSAT